MMKLSENFDLSELTKSQEASRHGLKNDPGPQEILALTVLCTNLLQPLREALGKPIIINSGYRNKDVNKMVGGSENSQHLLGEAADIEVNGMATYDLAQFIYSRFFDFDQLILEFYDPAEGPNSGWVHVSHACNGKQRKQVITKKYDGNGKVVTISGLVR